MSQFVEVSILEGKMGTVIPYRGQLLGEAGSEHKTLSALEESG